jgi:hypothetical protein
MHTPTLLNDDSSGRGVSSPNNGVLDRLGSRTVQGPDLA